MLGTLLLGGVIGILVATVAAFVALKLYGNSLRTSLIQQEGWERAQEARQQQWQLEQEKRVITLEKNIANNVRRVQHEWEVWEQRDALRRQELQHQYEAVAQRAALEHIVDRLPYLEEASLPPTEQHRRTTISSSIPVQLQGADLTGRDLSRRYLAGANLRGATLAHANLFMTDLSGACLAGADLTGADLSGANLMHADLREATLVGANVLVADLNDGILLGTKLQKIRNLTAEQVITTIHDSTTQFDEENEITLPRVPNVPKLALSSSSTPESTYTAYDIVRAQSLDAIPETPHFIESEQHSPAIEDESDDTLFVQEDEQEEGVVPTWTPTPSDEMVHLLEEFHLPVQEDRSTNTFDTSQAQQSERQRVQAS